MTTSENKAKLKAILKIGIEMDIFEEHLLNENGLDTYTTSAQAIRQGLEDAFDAGFKAAKSQLERKSS